MHTYPTVDDSADRLRRAHWSIGDVWLADGSWLVTGTNGENQINARGRTQSEAWYRACQQAGAVGMLGQSKRP